MTIFVALFAPSLDTRSLTKGAIIRNFSPLTLKNVVPLTQPYFYASSTREPLFQACPNFRAIATTIANLFCQETFKPLIDPNSPPFSYLYLFASQTLYLVRQRAQIVRLLSDCSEDRLRFLM